MILTAKTVNDFLLDQLDTGIEEEGMGQFYLNIGNFSFRVHNSVKIQL
jgi:hypothetical protein